MVYAWIENGTVTNLIELHPANAAEFPAALPTEDRPVALGDTCENGRFYRGGAEVLSPLAAAQKEIEELAEYAAEIEYQNALRELGMEG